VIVCESVGHGERGYDTDRRPTTKHKNGQREKAYIAPSTKAWPVASTYRGLNTPTSRWPPTVVLFLDLYGLPPEDLDRLIA
jgi:hypothetical protein